MPVLTAIQGEIAAALVTIIIGIVMEKWYVSWWSVGINVVNLIVVLTTLDLVPIKSAVLAIYVALGFFCALYRFNRAYFLFGSKTYGTLTFALGVLELPDWNQQLTIIAHGMRIVPSDSTQLFLFTWVLFAVIVHIIGEIYNHIGPQWHKEDEDLE